MQTLNFIKKNKNDDVLWLVKKHPSSEYYGENGVVEKVIKKINYKNIKLFPEKINTINAIKFCDAVFTGRGTIGMEFACYGKLAITAGEAPYSYMKFNKVFHNKDSYFKYIKKISNIKTINPSQSIIARKTLFFRNGK